MYFYPGKTKTYTRTFNRVRALVFAEKQLPLFQTPKEVTDQLHVTSVSKVKQNEQLLSKRRI